MQLQNEFAPMAELARQPSPAGKGDREAVDEESTCKTNLPEEMMSKKQPLRFLLPNSAISILNNGVNQ